ncbi:MAG TPA: glycoside hydrolase family 9 protein, partial [Saprospiraceae bacterium]|nr:glycoside hydrolase family 9 protein [Saprospiraceae bacterium]
SIDSYNAQTDLYRAQMDDWAHHWGSNQTRANCGNLNMDFVEFNINPGQATQYREVAEQYLHWFHGTNPLNLSMLSNMYAFGGDVCVNEIYHTWFGNNTPYDNALTSPKGPAPGYLTGGPNKDFTYTQLSPPANQPPQKSYKEFNDGWPQNSWEITEPAIYYNAAYILLLSNFAKQAVVPVDEPAQPKVLSEKDAFEVFPNPAGDSFFVRFPDARLRTVQVFDASGVLILEKQTTETQLTVELKNASAGVYRVGVNGVLKQMVKQ